MAEPRQRGPIANAWFSGLDRLVPGNNYNRTTGQWQATPLQYAGGAAGLLGNMVLPGLGTATRAGVHGYTTGQGVMGFLQPRGSFAGRPVNPMSFTPNFTPNGTGVGGTTTQPLTPAAQIPFNLPNAEALARALITSNGGQGGRGNNQNAGRPTLGGMAGLTGAASQMGGARGAHSQGGVTGDAARALFAALTSGPQTIYTGGNGPIMQ
jgi:hypothetical protein